MGICHRDLKSENILYVSSDPNSDIKIIDFGMSQVFREKKIMHSLKGTPHYVAPEILFGTYNHLVDCWSLGVLLYILLSGTTPFKGRNQNELITNIYNGYFDFTPEPFDHVTDLAKDLIARLLMKNPMVRITANQALEHPWITQNSPLPDIVIDESIFNNIKAFTESARMKKIVLNYISTKLCE